MTQHDIVEKIYEKVDLFFNNRHKATLWMIAENPLLGDLKPIDMIINGRELKLLQFVTQQLEANAPDILTKMAQEDGLYE